MKDQVNNILTNQHFQKLLGSDAVAIKSLETARAASASGHYNTAIALLKIGLSAVRSDCCGDGYEEDTIIQAIAFYRKKLDGITSSESTSAKMNFCINCKRCSIEDTWLGERYFCILEERKEEPDYDYVMGEVINTEPITRRKKMLCRKARGTLRHCPYFVLGVPTIKTKEK